MTSHSITVSEDFKRGTVISLISVTDKDSGLNGKINMSITSSGPFGLKHCSRKIYIQFSLVEY